MKLPDHHIRKLALEHGMIEPFYEGEQGKPNKIGSGLTSYGYDISLSPKGLKLVKNIPGQKLDPKSFDPRHLQDVELQKDETGEYFVIPGYGYALGVSVERLSIPRDIFVEPYNKSTYARSCIGVNHMSPVEPGWTGYLTMEISNDGPTETKVYANEGICQLVFDKSVPCETSYEDRKGKYQNQKQEVTLPKA